MIEAKMIRNEFDGGLYIKSDSKLELNSIIEVTNLKGESVKRQITTLHSQFDGFQYEFKKPASEPAAHHVPFSLAPHAGDRCLECGRVITNRFGKCSCGGM